MIIIIFFVRFCFLGSSENTQSRKKNTMSSMKDITELDQCDTVRLSACILCNIMSLYLNCCLELKIEILKYMFGFQGQAIDFRM